MHMAIITGYKAFQDVRGEFKGFFSYRSEKVSETYTYDEYLRYDHHIFHSC